MPPRVARSSVQGSRPSKPRAGGRNPKKAQKRALNAFSIASHEHPDRVKIRKNRLGELDPSFHRKRSRHESGDEDDDDEDEESNEPKRRKQLGDNVEEGSDSDGNTWTMGHVDDDDDEEIDSDEAFGESDEERFADFTFRGSAQNQTGKKSVKSKKREAPTDDSEGDIDLDEGESADGEEEDEDDLGEDAIDLATALDQWEEDEEDNRKKKNKKKNKTSAFESSDESPGSDEHSDSSSEDEDEEDRRAQLQDLISSLPNQDPGHSWNKRVEVHESSAPDEFGVSRKVDLTSFKPKGVDDERKKALKLLQDDKSSKRNDIARKLDAPLPKRQQDKLDRAAANTKTNETLDRWTDTIKQNRRAEHLSFPLQHKNSGKSMGEDRLLPTTASAPTNDLENAIQSILQQSGLSNGKDDEEQIQKWEELQTNKLPLEEVLRRRAELRRERELLFREEVRAKRIKKIKSKAYRRVHRKERERLLERERDALKADGVDVSEDEREYNDRRRAEERMGAKHRESKWAKGVKATGRAAWDADALTGVTEMAKRNEELRRRIEGKAIRDSDDEGSDVPSSDESSEEDEEGGDEVLQRQLSKLKHNPFATDNSKLGQMAFMQKAEAARRAQNDEAIESMRRELAGEDSISEDEVENSIKVGRRKFGPGGDDAAPANQLNRSEFEERAGSDEEQETSTNLATDGPSNGSRKDKYTKKNATNGMANATRKPVRTDDNGEVDVGSQNPYLVKAKKDRKTESEPVDCTFLDDMVSKTQKKSQSMSKPASKVLESEVDEFLQQRVTVPDNEGWTTVLGDDQEEDDDQYDDLENEGVDLDVVLRNQQLTAKGFAGDDVLAEFESEKKATIQEEDSQEITNVLPGWGAWTGENLTAAEKKRKGFKTVTKREGIDPTLRKDAKLDRVIINEKRMKPNVKYMASQLPFPFETREQYERSLRVPKGKEWTTKKTFQDATKPRVIVKQGIIKPMRKPMV